MGIRSTTALLAQWDRSDLAAIVANARFEFSTQSRMTWVPDEERHYDGWGAWGDAFYWGDGIKTYDSYCATLIPDTEGARIYLTDDDADAAIVLNAMQVATDADETYIGDADYDDTPPPEPPTIRPITGTWQSMHFRSKAELAVAKELERRCVAFWMNPHGRFGPTPDWRVTREVDFLVLHEGRFGILEVDGPTHDGRAADDHQRDELFHLHGIRVVRRFRDDEARLMPQDVVARFLRQLEING